MTGTGGATQIEENPGWVDAFDSAGAIGVFALHRIGATHVLVSELDRSNRPYLPASTFKIPNSLIALELGIVEDETTEFPMTWEPTEIEIWNRQHTFASALRYSVVPIYQSIAREVSEERYQGWLARMDYGNADAGGGVDHFWLDGALRTSALDQVDFLSRLVTARLPVSKRSRRIVRQMLLQESSACFTLYGKTGLVGVAARRKLPAAERVGWYVGWVETDIATWTFALNLDIRGSEDAGKRVPLAKELLAQAGVLPRTACAQGSGPRTGGTPMKVGVAPSPESQRPQHGR